MNPRPFVPGWFPQLADNARAQLGDRLVTLGAVADDRPLPPSFSLAQYRKWNFDQGQVGSCFANASAQAAQIDMTFGDPTRAFQVSRRLVWYGGRKLDGLLGNHGDGGSVTNAVMCLCDGQGGLGAAHEELWPYKASHSWLEAKPPQSVLDDAQKDQLTQFAEVPFGDPWKRQIYSGRPIVIGIWWPNGWDEAVGPDGRATGVGRGGFGHALAVIGWAQWPDGQNWWQIENSHGPIYHPVPADMAATIPGYVPAAADMTFDFWASDAMVEAVNAKGNSEAVCAAGPDGFVKRDPVEADDIFPWV